jgi:Spy/CpxP family protein refolding chaperone
MSPRRISTVAAIVLVLGSAIAFAKPSSLFPKPAAQAPVEQKDRGDDGWLKELNLTPDQVQKIQAIRNRYKDNLTKQRQAMQQAQKELKSLMASDASAEQIRQKYDQFKTIRQQLGDTRFNSLLEIRNVLNLEQRKKFAEHMRGLGGRGRDHFK